MRSNSVLKAHNKNSQQYNTENFKLLSLLCFLQNGEYNRHNKVYYLLQQAPASQPTSLIVRIRNLTYLLQNHTLVQNEKICSVR